MIESDDELSLSSHALAALAEFKNEEKDRITKFEALYEAAQKSEEEEAAVVTSIDVFPEDWQLSQFWYADSTADKLARAMLEGADEDTVIVIASAPSIYAAIKRIPKDEVPTKHIYLLEFDKRFELLSGADHFFFYDYNTPDEIPPILKNKCHRLLIDPPFLGEVCQRRSSVAAHNLLVKDKLIKTKNGDLQYKLCSSTGERVWPIIKECYPDVRVTDFIPEHRGLQNEFRCYALFASSEWGLTSIE